MVKRSQRCGMGPVLVGMDRTNSATSPRASKDGDQWSHPEVSDGAPRTEHRDTEGSARRRAMPLIGMPIFWPMRLSTRRMPLARTDERPSVSIRRRNCRSFDSKICNG